MITYFKRTIRDKRIKRLPKFAIGSWINVVDPTIEEIRYLCKTFGLDKRNLLSSLDQNEIPRMEEDAESLYIFTKTMVGSNELQTYLIVISEKFILTVSKNEPEFIKTILNNKIEFITTQKLKCLIKLLSMINKEFEKSTMNIVKLVNVKKNLTSKLKEHDVNELLKYEDILNSFVSSYYYMNLLYQRIIKRIRFFESDKEILEDLIVEANQGFDLCKSSLKTISNIRNYYLVLLSNKLNRIITILTIFTIFLSIPAAISGIYGMNVKLPLQENPLAFYYILPFIAMCWIFFLAYLKRQDVI